MFFLCSILFQIIFIFDVIAAKGRCRMIWLRIQIDRINRLWRRATPFFPDGVTLLAR